MTSKPVALMVYGDAHSTRNALTEEKYKALAQALFDENFIVESILYHDSKAAQLADTLTRFCAILVWVNPIEQGNDRSHLDALLLDLSQRGVFVTTHPEVILKIGTKQVLYTTRHMDWGGDIELYTEYADFEKRFLTSLKSSGIRILKQYRGNGGNGVFKVSLSDDGLDRIRVVHAPAPDEERVLTLAEFHSEFSKYFDNGGMLINQPWAPGIINGMVRCYLTGTKVSGFGYQESNALCPRSDDPESGIRPVSARFYFSEDCGLFQDLREIMESKWVPQLQEIHGLVDASMPLLWDADFFINDVNTRLATEKYTLCEINVSSVSPFPPSCIPHVVGALKTKLSV